MRTFARRMTMAAAVLASLSACSIYKDYERPDSISLDGIYGEYGSSDTTGLADLGWKVFFSDPQLEALIEKGLENNADLKVASQKIIEAQAGLDVAKWSLFPTLGVKPSWQIENGERYGGTVQGWSVSPSVSWEADLRGSLLNSRRYSEASLEQAELYELTVRTELVATIAGCYYTLQMLDAQLEISRTTAASWKENVRIMKAMKAAGMTNEASLSQTEANSCSIDASLFDLESKIRQTENTLSLLLGVAPSHFERGKFSDEQIVRDLTTGVPALLLSRRPDVMSAEQELRKAYYNSCAARAAFYPSVTLSGDYGWEKALTTPAGWLLGAAAGAVAPIWNAGKNRAGLKIAQARQEEALVNFNQTILKAGNEVNDAILKCNTARSKTDIRVQQIQALEKAVESTQQLMRHSQSTYLEVLTAQQSLLSAQLLQISDHFDAVQGMIALYRALGGGAQ